MRVKRILRRLMMAIVVCVVAFAINQSTKNLAESWRWWIMAILAALISHALTGRDRLGEESIFEVQDGDGTLPELASVTTLQLGIHQGVLPGVIIDRTSQMPGRADSRAVEEAIVNNTIVIVTAPRLSGSSTLLMEAALEVLPSWTQVGVLTEPSPASIRRGLREIFRRMHYQQDALLWIERCDYDALIALEEEVCARTLPANLNILVSTAVSQIPVRLDSVSRHLHLDEISPEEEEILRSNSVFTKYLPSLDEGERLLGRLLVNLTGAREYLHSLRSDPLKCSIAFPVIHWNLEGLGQHIPMAALRDLYPLYFSLMTRPSDALKATEVYAPPLEFAEALERSIVDADSAGLPWIRKSFELERLWPSPLLPQALRSSRGVAIEAPLALWKVASAFISKDVAHQLATEALLIGCADRSWSLLESHPAEAELLVQVAEQLRLQGSTEQAKMCLYRALEDTRAVNQGRILVDIANLARGEGSLDEALSCYERASRLGEAGSASEAEFHWGDLERGRHNIGGARLCYERAISYGDPRHSSAAAARLGELAECVGDVEAARVAFRQAAALGDDEHRADGLLKLGKLEMKANRTGPARQAFFAAMKCGSPRQVAFAANEIGRLEADSRRIRRARHSYRRAMALRQPDESPRAAVLLGDLEAGEDREKEAIAAYQFAVKAKHKDHAPYALYKLGELALTARHPLESKTLFELSMEYRHSSHSAAAACSLGAMLGDLDLAPSAIRAYMFAREIGTDEWRSHALVAISRICLANLLFTEARKAIDEALRINCRGEVAAAYHALGDLEDRLRRWDEARAAYQSAIDAGSSHAGVLKIHMGLLDWHEGRTDRARSVFRTAANSGEDWIAAHGLLHLGQLEASLGNRDSAVACWTKGAQLSSVYAERCSTDLIRTGDLTRGIPDAVWRNDRLRSTWSPGRPLGSGEGVRGRYERVGVRPFSTSLGPATGLSSAARMQMVWDRASSRVFRRFRVKRMVRGDAPRL